MKAEGLIHGESGFATTLTLLTAVALLLIGVAPVLSMEFHAGPFD